jgi:hypothetical protein
MCRPLLKSLRLVHNRSIFSNGVHCGCWSYRHRSRHIPNNPVPVIGLLRGR